MLEGPHDFARNPWAPPGCRALINEPANNRQSWAPIATDAWYLSPAKEHYRCCQFYVPETRGYRISGAAKFFSEWCQVPDNTEADKKVE